MLGEQLLLRPHRHLRRNRAAGNRRRARPGSAPARCPGTAAPVPRPPRPDRGWRRAAGRPPYAHVGKLRDAQARVERAAAHPHAERRIPAFHMALAVPGEGGDAVAARDAERREGTGEQVAALPQRRIVDPRNRAASPAAGDHLLLRMPFGGVGEELRRASAHRAATAPVPAHPRPELPLMDANALQNLCLFLPLGWHRLRSPVNLHLFSSEFACALICSLRAPETRRRWESADEGWTTAPRRAPKRHALAADARTRRLRPERAGSGRGGRAAAYRRHAGPRARHPPRHCAPPITSSDCRARRPPRRHRHRPRRCRCARTSPIPRFPPSSRTMAG